MTTTTTFQGLYVRWKDGDSRTFPEPGDGLLDDFCVGWLGRQPVTLLVIGPGDDEEYRAKHAAGRYYPANAIAVHAACLGVTVTDDNEGHGDA